MAEDIVRKMGFMTLGSRFKRIGERMQADVLRFMEQMDIPAQPSQCPLLIALDDNGPLTVGELAEAVGTSQPGVTRNLARLTELRLIAPAPAGADGRQKAVVLTAAGKRILERAKREVWPHIEAAVAEICEGLKGPLLTQLTAIEDGLAEAPLDQRASARLTKRQRRASGPR
jgi:DNA-binding MarR family transcriptional regulator